MHKNGELKIEKGIPIPPAGGNLGKGYSAVLRRLKKGESVLLPVKIQTATNLGRQISGPGHFSCRSVDGGTRVWRIT